MNETMKSGAQVYYTGDMANPSGHFVVTSVAAFVTLKETDGDRTFKVSPSQIGHKYEGHCNPRFVTEEARQAYRAALKR